MLLYRLKNEKRNEKFMRLTDFDEHLTKLLERERTQQIEADRLKEYMENVCKIKVIVPALISSTSSPSSSVASELSNSEQIKQDTTPMSQPTSIDDPPPLIEITRKRTEKVLEIHKDLTLEMAKEQIIKVK